MSRFAVKQFEKLPFFILKKVHQWEKSIFEHGLENTRKFSSYHDEPLKGDRFGQRSVRLNRAWRLIYEEHEDESQTWITIIVVEVNKHDY